MKHAGKYNMKWKVQAIKLHMQYDHTMYQTEQLFAATLCQK